MKEKSSIPIKDNQSINQASKQASNVYSANVPGEDRLSGATAESVFNSKIDERVP